MSGFDVLAAILFIAPIPGWTATVILAAAAYRRPRIGALTERAVASVILSSAATIAAVLGYARLGRLPVDRELATFALAIICLLVSVPAVLWLLGFIRGDFGSDE